MYLVIYAQKGLPSYVGTQSIKVGIKNISDMMYITKHFANVGYKIFLWDLVMFLV